MALDNDFRLYLERLRNATTLSDFLRKRVTLKKRGHEWSGLCPFHKEKTPSFYVNDAKGFYHCFGCGAHGDALKWLREKEGLDFINAVRTLAREIGFAAPPAPKPRTPEERKIEDRRERLLRLMEAATRYYTSALQSDTPQAGRARRYLTEDRGLSATTIAEFRLGYAPSEGSELLHQLRDQGFKDTEILATGLARKQEHNQAALRTFFFERILFPITNTGGQVVSFGGRALSETVRAKYINGADTEIFSKGRLLYNLHKAAPEIRKSKTAWLVEGYMDTIALANAGIATAVAPLGTAITEDQWRLLLRQSDSPILCMDGDSAGRRAAVRAAEVALPLLVAGKSPRFVFLPDGYDPDDIVRNARDGAQTFATLANAALSLADLLWSAKTEGLDFKAPERVALLDRDLNGLTERIADPTMRRAYRGELRARLNSALWEARRGQATATGYSPKAYDKRERGGGVIASSPARIGEHASALRAGLSRNRAVRELRPLAMVLRDPWLAAEFYEKLTELPIRAPAVARLREAVLDVLAARPDLDSQGLADYLRAQGFSSTLTRLMVSQGAEGQVGDAGLSVSPSAVGADLGTGTGTKSYTESGTESRTESRAETREQAIEENWALRGHDFEQDKDYGDKPTATSGAYRASEGAIIGDGSKAYGGEVSSDESPNSESPNSQSPNSESPNDTSEEVQAEAHPEARAEAHRARVREEFRKSLAYCQAGESQFISFWRTRGSASLAHLSRRVQGDTEAESKPDAESDPDASPESAASSETEVGETDFTEEGGGAARHESRV